MEPPQPTYVRNPQLAATARPDVPTTRTEHTDPEASELHRAPVRSSPLYAEPTRRVDPSSFTNDVERSKERTPGPAEPGRAEPGRAEPGPAAQRTPAPRPRPRPSARLGRTDPRLLEKALDEETREVIPKKKPITSPELLKKSTGGRITGEGRWSGGAATPPTSSDWEDVSTEIGDPDQMAELMLKQGFIERAITIYERLVALNPKRVRYQTRLDEIREMAARGAPMDAPADGAGPIASAPEPAGLDPDPPTAEVDVSQMRELDAMRAPEDTLGEPARLEARGPAREPPSASEILDRMAPSLDDGPVVLDEVEVELASEWVDDDTTVVGSALDEEEEASRTLPPAAPPASASGAAAPASAAAPNPFEHAAATVLDQRRERPPSRALVAPGGTVMVHRIIRVE